jgi:hypothetical protein
MRLNGLPAPSEVAKRAVPSDGLGDHDHDGYGPHGHGPPSFEDNEVNYLAQLGMHTDRHHGRVIDASGGVVPPSIVGAKILNARRKGLLESPTSAQGDAPVSKSGSGIGESTPVVEHLDLRHDDPRSNDNPK